MSDVQQQRVPPHQQKVIKCSLHGEVNSMVLFNNEITEFSQQITDVAHICPHCYIATVARTQGVEVLNPKPYCEEAKQAIAQAEAAAKRAAEQADENEKDGCDKMAEAMAHNAKRREEDEKYATRKPAVKRKNIKPRKQSDL